MELSLNEKLLAKRNSLRLLADSVGIFLDDIPFQYPNEVFTDRLTEGLAKQAINLRLSDLNYKKLNELCSITYNRDVRTAVEYGIDLIYGWLAEDIVYHFLIKNGFYVVKNGVDKERAFLKNSNIKSDLDVVVGHSKKSRMYDIYFDSNGYWNKYNKMDIRESKWKEIHKQNAGVICISNFGFAVIDGSSEHTLAPNGAWGGKMSAKIEGVRELLMPPQDFVVSLKEHISQI